MTKPLLPRADLITLFLETPLLLMGARMAWVVIAEDRITRVAEVLAGRAAFWAAFRARLLANSISRMYSGEFGTFLGAIASCNVKYFFSNFFSCSASFCTDVPIEERAPRTIPVNGPPAFREVLIKLISLARFKGSKGINLGLGQKSGRTKSLSNSPPCRRGGASFVGLYGIRQPNRTVHPLFQWCAVQSLGIYISTSNCI